MKGLVLFKVMYYLYLCVGMCMGDGVGRGWWLVVLDFLEFVVGFLRWVLGMEFRFIGRVILS